MPNSQPPPLLASMRTFPPAVWFLFLGSFLNKFGTFVVPFLTLYMLGEGYSKGEIGFVIGAYGVGNLISAAAGGQMADTIGRRKTIILSMVLAAIGILALSQANSFWSLFLLTLVVGFSGELYRPAASALLIDLVPEERRAAAWATYRVAHNAGWMFGPATAGLLSSHAWIWLFVGDAATCLIFAFVAWVALPKGVKSTEAPRSWLSAVGVIRRDRTFLLFLLALFGPGMLLMQTHASYSTYIVEDLDYTKKVYGYLLSLNGLLIILFELPITSITQRFPIRRVMATGFGLLGIGFAMSGLSASLVVLALSMAVMTTGEMIAFPLIGSFVSKLAPEDMRGRYMGANGCVWSISMIFGPALGLLLYEGQPMVFWWTCLLVGLASAVVISIEPKRLPS